jgi:DNA polymerase I-like protein with 3'-5' exonuclease and polymerase domains
MQETLVTVRTLEELERVKEYLANPEFDFVAFDTETTGVEKDSEIIGYSISCEVGVGIYVLLAEWVVDNEQKPCPHCPPVQFTKSGKPKKNQKKCKVCKGLGFEILDKGKLVRHPELKAASRPLIESLLNKRMIMHNGIFDCEVVNREFGVQLLPALHTDTQELAHVLNENESAGLKEVASRLYGEDATAEKEAMKASVIANGGIWQEKRGGIKEMYKADPDLIALYGAKDTVLTLNLFYELIPQLFAEGLDKFFYEEESMPLIKGPTYHLNSSGLKVDLNRIKQIEKELSEECSRLKAEIEESIAPLVSEKYPNGFGSKKPGAFNIGSAQQLAWLLFVKLDNYFLHLTPGGKKVAKDFVGRIPYSNKAKREFMQALEENNLNPAKYLKCDATALEAYEGKYPWAGKLLQYRAAGKMLKTYVGGIKKGVRYGIIYPSFLQHGTTSGRYSSRDPNFQNLPRDDKRIKSCIISRPGKVFVGADYSQLEPRVFASVSQDPKLMESFAKGQDFYSVIGVELCEEQVRAWERKTGKKIGLKKKDENFFGNIFEDERQVSKTFCLATPYGTSAFQQSEKLKRPHAECQAIIDTYFAKFPSVEAMMLESHAIVKRDGVVFNLYGRPRRIPEAMEIEEIFGNFPHSELPYEARTLLNLAMNHRVQSTAASIVNRSAIAFCKKILALGINAKIVLQVHDEINVECDEKDAELVAQILKECMETTVTLPGVALQAEPKIARSLAELK